jgi:hypothetical protein
MRLNQSSTCDRHKSCRQQTWTNPEIYFTHWAIHHNLSDNYVVPMSAWQVYEMSLSQRFWLNFHCPGSRRRSNFEPSGEVCCLQSRSRILLLGLSWEWNHSLCDTLVRIHRFTWRHFADDKHLHDRRLKTRQNHTSGMERCVAFITRLSNSPVAFKRVRVPSELCNRKKNDDCS